MQTTTQPEYTFYARRTPFDPKFGPTPFHLGCNALTVNGNCGPCNPVHGPVRPPQA